VSGKATLSVSAPPVSRAAAVVRAVDVWKAFGRRTVLAGVDLQMQSGRTLAIVGPNGAGKTTLLRILATLSRPSSGSVEILGDDVLQDPIPARRRIGVVLSNSLLYDDLTAAENLRFYARLYGLPDATARIAELAQLVGLEGRLDERCGAYSRGMQQRLSLARALLHGPDLLLLDEPDAGLDPQTTADLRQMLRADGAARRAVVLTCHDLDLALQLAEDVAVMVAGRFTLAAPTQSLTTADLRGAFSAGR
jgi:heme exporter protein A